MLRLLAAGILLTLVACAPDGPSGGGSPFDGIYSGSGRVVEGPRYCGDATGEAVAMVVRGGQARIALTSNAIEGPVGSDGDLSALRWSGRETLFRPPSSQGRITGNAYRLRYTHDHCTYEMEGRRR